MELTTLMPYLDEALAIETCMQKARAYAYSSFGALSLNNQC